MKIFITRNVGDVVRFRGRDQSQVTLTLVRVRRNGTAVLSLDQRRHFMKLLGEVWWFNFQGARIEVTVRESDEGWPVYDVDLEVPLHVEVLDASPSEGVTAE